MISKSVTLIMTFIPKNGEQKTIAIPDVYNIAAEKTEDKGTCTLPSESTADNSTKTVDTKYEEKTTEMDEIRIILCPERPQNEQNHCYTKDDRPNSIKQVVIKLFFNELCSFKYCRYFNNPVFRLIFLLWVFIYYLLDYIGR